MISKMTNKLQNINKKGVQHLKSDRKTVQIKNIKYFPKQI